MIRFALLGSLMLLTACGSSQPAPTLYRLQPAAFDAPLARTGALSVREPVASPGLESARIAVIDSNGEQTFYQGVRWSANAPLLVQHYLADSLERAGAFTPVLTDETAAEPAWLLETRLQDFQVDRRGGRTQLAIRLTAVLIDARSHKPVQTVPLVATRDVSGLRMAGIVAAFNDALDGLTRDLAHRLAR